MTILSFATAAIALLAFVVILSRYFALKSELEAKYFAAEAELRGVQASFEPAQAADERLDTPARGGNSLTCPSHLFDVERQAFHASRPGLRIAEYTINPTQKVPWHCHSNVQGTFYVLEGHLQIFLRRRTRSDGNRSTIKGNLRDDAVCVPARFRFCGCRFHFRAPSKATLEE